MTGLRDRHISADVRATAAPAHRMRAWRFLCSFGVDSGLMETDPSAGATTPKRPKTIGHPAWTVEDIAAFRARWPLDSAARRCMELLFWTGARISDAAKIGPGMVDTDGVLI
jgi:site-specific recombinase XerC